MKKILKGLLGVCLCLPLVVGCSSEKDATDLVVEAMKAMQDVESMSGDYSMKFGVSMASGESDKMSMNMNFKGDYEFAQNPLFMHMNMEMNISSFGQEEKQTMEMYGSMAEDKVAMYMYSEELGWVSSMTEEIPNYTELIAPKAADEKLIKALEPKSIKSEKVNGVNTDRVKISINKKSVKNILKMLPDMEGLSEVEEIPETVMDEINKLNDDISLDFFMNIDKKTKRIVAYEISISKEAKKEIEKLINEQMGEQMGGAEISIDNLSFVFNIKEFDKVKDAVVPQEVIESAVSTDMGLGSIDEEIDVEDPTSNDVEGDLATQTHLWESMKFNLDGKDFILKEVKVQELADLGYKLSDDKLSDKLKKDDYKIVYMEKGDTEFTVSLDNYGKKATKIKDALVGSIATYDNIPLIIEGNIKVGSTKAEIIAAYGEPNTTITEGNYENLDYHTEDYLKTLSISMSDGIVDSISISLF